MTLYTSQIGYLPSPSVGSGATREIIPATPLGSLDTIGLFSPSEPLIPSRLATLHESLLLLTQQGLTVKWASHSREIGTYSAGTPGQRLSDIHELVSDPDVRALFATWGGKSCNQLLAGLDFDLISRARKPIIGFSDVAVLLNAITAATGLITFHHLVAGRLLETAHPDLGLVRGDPSSHSDLFDFGSFPERRAVFRAGEATGLLYGGNLSTFVLGLVGTQFLAAMRDVVFFWESASERPMVIDQNLTTLRNAGFFDRVRGMVVGSVHSGSELSIDEIGEAISHAVAHYHFPIIYAPTFGHLPTRNPVIPIGAKCTMSSETFRVELREPEVVASTYTP